MSTSDILKLIEIPRNDDQLLLYPEYAERPDRFDFSSDIQRMSFRSSRKVELVIPDHNALPFVAKYERHPKEHYRKKLSPPNVSQNTNLTFREISIARALSRLATHEDEHGFIRFEQPIGYYAKRDGQRIALFEYIPEIQDIKKYSLVELEALLEASRWEMELRLKPIKKSQARCLAQANVETAYWSLQGGLEDLYFPYHLGRMIMAHNGVKHNEFDRAKDGRYIDPKTSKPGVHIIDFEFCRRIDEGNAAQEIRHLVQALLDLHYTLEGSGSIIERARALLPKDRPDLLERIEIRVSQIMELIKSRFGIDPLAEEEASLQTMGPAYSVIHAIPETPEECIVSR